MRRLRVPSEKEEVRKHARWGRRWLEDLEDWLHGREGTDPRRKGHSLFLAKFLSWGTVE